MKSIRSIRYPVIVPLALLAIAMAATPEARAQQPIVLGTQVLYSSTTSDRVLITHIKDPNDSTDTGDYFLVDRCNASGTSCGPLVPGHERLSRNALLAQDTSDGNKSVKDGTADGVLGIVAMTGGDSIVAGVAGVVGAAAAPWAIAGLGLATIGTLTYKGTKWAIRTDEYANIEIGQHADNSTKVLSVGSYENALREAISSPRNAAANANADKAPNSFVGTGNANTPAPKSTTAL